MDYGKAFTFLFNDKKWIGKFLVGVVISLVPIVNFAGYGYMIQLLKNVRDGAEETLPDWDDFGKYFVDGLKFMLGFLVYLIPVILLSFFVLIFAIVADAAGDAGDAFGVAMMLLTCLIFFFTFLPMLLYPALFIQYGKEDHISDMFKLREMRDLFKANSGNYIIVLIMVLFVVGFIASFGMLFCFIGIFFTAWYAQLVSAHMIGQLALPKEKPPTNLA